VDDSLRPLLLEVVLALGTNHSEVVELFTATVGEPRWAVYTRNGTLTVSNDTFVDNAASDEGGAIDNWAGGTVIVNNAIIQYESRFRDEVKASNRPETFDEVRLSQRVGGWEE
jgi:hypothetical protein